MKLVNFDINKHDLNKVSGLIYETDSETLKFFFKNKKNASERIEKLLKSNGIRRENVYAVTKDGDQVFGVLVAFKGNEDDIMNDLKAYFRILGFIDALKFVLLEIGGFFVGTEIDKDDYYLSDVAVDENCRSKGVGTFILEKSIEIARKKGCKRVVLDVNLKNDRALKLYKRIGFKIFKKKTFKWFNREKGLYHMEYRLDLEGKYTAD